mgnify:CR=1 FL=1
MKHNQKGMTLIEIMVSLLIGAFLIGGVIKIFTNTHQTYRVQENLSRIQESGRFAMEFMTRDIRMADFWGCVDVSQIENKLKPSAIFDLYASGIAGSDDDNGGNDGDADNDENANGIWDGTDIITLRGASAVGIGIETQPTNNAAALKVKNNSGLEVNDIVLISNCSAGDIFQLSNITANASAGFEDFIHNTGGNSSIGDPDFPGNATAKLEAKKEVDATGPLDGLYGVDSNIYKMQMINYRIGISVSGAPALFRSINTGSFQTLIEGVEDMQILYGEDTNADNSADYYVDANDVVSMENVISLRISLVIRSLEDNLTLTSRPYDINYVTVTPTDKRIRRVFTSTIAVRNRLP